MFWHAVPYSIKPILQIPLYVCTVYVRLVYVRSAYITRQYIFYQLSPLAAKYFVCFL
jgi:hypothetical protein